MRLRRCLMGARSLVGRMFLEARTAQEGVTSHLFGVWGISRAGARRMPLGRW